MIDAITDLWAAFGPQSIYDWQTVAATLALISSAIFTLLYSRVTWWKGECEEHIEVLLPADKRIVRSSV